MSAENYHADNHLRLFKEIPLDLTQALNADIAIAIPIQTYQGFFVSDVFIVKDRVGGAFTTDPQVQLRVGTTASSSVVVAATTLTDVQGELHRITLPTTSVAIPTSAAKFLFLRISTAAVGQATATRARAAGIATIGSTAHGLLPGDITRVLSLGGTGYNGVVTVLTAPTANLFTYASPGTNEVQTNDTAGRFGVFDASVFVHGLYW